MSKFKYFLTLLSVIISSCSSPLKIEQSSKKNSLLFLKMVYNNGIMSGKGGGIVLMNKETGEYVVGQNKGLNPYIVIPNIEPGYYAVERFYFNDGYNQSSVPNILINEVSIKQSTVNFLGSYKATTKYSPNIHFEVYEQFDIDEKKIKELVEKSSTFSQLPIVHTNLIISDTIVFEGRLKNYN